MRNRKGSESLCQLSQAVGSGCDCCWLASKRPAEGRSTFRCGQWPGGSRAIDSRQALPSALSPLRRWADGIGVPVSPANNSRFFGISGGKAGFLTCLALAGRETRPTFLCQSPEIPESPIPTICGRSATDCGNCFVQQPVSFLAQLSQICDS